ncbi:hypothetical protein GT204_12360 [Streptomyces sp. SID4919]|uniref:MarR family winged helix-turn-helix transcriptional regulator n=1 Tax=unclassified Streptomyces TaxID=2593676 RepID=UPI000C07AD5A|nr:MULTISPECIES: hypothetical protein [unclassified Streptomyces]MYY09682.1 hypothetical protein [Streptomyces sp. SID4919]
MGVVTALVRRDPCQGDARAVLVALTEEGREVAQRFHEGTTSRIEALPAGLTDAERTGLAELLARIVRDNKVPLVFPAMEEASPLPPRVHVSWCVVVRRGVAGTRHRRPYVPAPRRPVTGRRVGHRIDPSAGTPGRTGPVGQCRTSPAGPASAPPASARPAAVRDPEVAPRLPAARMAG